MVRAQISSAVAPAANSRASPSAGTGMKPAQCGQRPRVRAPVKEHAEDSRQLHAAAAGGQDEPRDRLDVVVAHHLRQIELRQKLGRGQEVHLPLGIRMRIRPAAEDQRGIAFPKELSQLPGVRDRRAGRRGSCRRPGRRAPGIRSGVRAPRTTAQYSSECFDVRNGTIRSRGTS